MEKEKWENQEGESDDDSENDLDYQPDRKKLFHSNNVDTRVCI
jgi:hypothetical protein